MPLHPAWAKNIARRVLWGALEKDITKAERQHMKDYFKSRCAYCECTLEDRWHADHLVNIDQGGFNHISNRVPSCPRCNEIEKKDLEWKSFLRRKYKTNKNKGQALINSIKAWIKANKPDSPPVPDNRRRAWEKEVHALEKTIQSSYDRLKDYR